MDQAEARLEAGVALGRRIEVSGTVIHAGVLLAARVWLSQAIFVHQIMMMMRAKGVAEALAVGETLTWSVAPLLLAMGLRTRPVALLLLLGVGQRFSEMALTWPQPIFLTWRVIGGAGPMSFDYLLRGGLARVPIWAVRATSRLYHCSDTLGADALPLGTRLYLAFVIAQGTGVAAWPVPFNGDLVTAPWWRLLLCWALVFGIATRAAAVLLCALSMLIVLVGVVPDPFEVMLLLVAHGAGQLSLDGLAARWAAIQLRMQDRSSEKVPRIVQVGGGFGGLPAVRALRWTACRILGYPEPGSFRYRHYGNLSTIGRLVAVVEVGRLRLRGVPAWRLWGLAYVLLLTGGRNRATVVLDWLWAYITYRHGTRLITRTTMDASVIPLLSPVTLGSRS